MKIVPLSLILFLIIIVLVITKEYSFNYIILSYIILGLIGFITTYEPRWYCNLSKIDKTSDFGIIDSIGLGIFWLPIYIGVQILMLCKEV